MTTEPLLVSLGALVIAFTGDLPALAPDSLLGQFLCSEGTPEVFVRVRRTDCLPVPDDAGALYAAKGFVMYRRGTRRFACKKDMNRPDGRIYAVLCYDEATADHMTLFYHTGRMRLDVESLLSSIMLETVLLRHGRCILHASFLSYEGKGIVFTAPSGTGKSTQAALWHDCRGAEIINGDKALLRWDGDRLLACGLPLCGSSGICRNKTVPLDAVVVLAQSKENSAEILRGVQAVKAVLPQIYTQPGEADSVSDALNFAVNLARNVPVWRLRCLPDETAVTCLEEALKKEK